MNSSAKFFAGLIFALSVAGGVARADVTLGNLGATGAGSLGTLSQGFTTEDFAVSFTTGTDANFLQLTDVVVGLAQQTTGNVTAALYSDVASAPGSLLPWSNTQSVTAAGTGAKVTFTASPLQLSPTTTYWMVLDAANSGWNWYRAEPNVAPTVENSSGWSYGTSVVSTTGGWTALGVNNSVSISAVPEPESMLLATGVAAMLAGGFLRKRVGFSA
jgi:hypothetical protein